MLEFGMFDELGCAERWPWRCQFSSTPLRDYSSKEVYDLHSFMWWRCKEANGVKFSSFTSQGYLSVAFSMARKVQST